MRCGCGDGIQAYSFHLAVRAMTMTIAAVWHRCVQILERSAITACRHAALEALLSKRLPSRGEGAIYGIAASPHTPIALEQS